MAVVDEDKAEYEANKKKKGIMNKRRSVKVEDMPYRPENKNLSKAEFLAFRAKYKKADQAAKEARNNVLKDSGLESKAPATVGDQEDIDQAQAKVDELKTKIKATKAKLDAEPGNPKLAKSLTKLEEQLNDAEDALDELEGN